MELHVTPDCEMLKVVILHTSSHIEAGMITGAHAPKKGYRTIRVPLAESEYDRFLTNRAYAKAQLEEFSEDVPAWFPDAFPWG